MESNEFLEIINSRRNQNRKEYEIEFRYISEIFPIQNLETITYENALIFFSNKIKFRPNQIKFFIQKIPLLEKRTLLESIEDCIRKLSEKDKKISKNHYIIDIKVDSDISKQRRRRQEQEQREQEEKRRREEEERKRREKEERERDKEKRVYCGYVCKSCHYSCTLQKGHKGLHSVQHGNMRYSTLVTEKGKNGIESEEYHLKTGESSKQIICTHQCLLGGRGHIHLIPLDEINLNKVPQSFRKLIRYSDKEYSDNVQYYEATCHFYWNFYLKFKSGFSKEQEFEFSRCGAICGAEIHENHQSHSHEKKLKQVHALEFLGRKTENEEIPYCVLPLWHSKWIPNQFPKGYQQGFTSREGHFFPCNHGREFDFGKLSSLLVN
ncbi:protein sey1 [Anaeramoeba ignava]|uniref:Protein sey1 n=1 Tax=Anaeramoeba ignava TaxID=1746090 RepID=A0A9Q0LN15_ANAIG|nr:protein sey1 [Anaeramoeba ignava]